MVWPLNRVVIIGTLPGVFIGYYLRVIYLPDPRLFKVFVGCVLLYIGARLLYKITARAQRGKTQLKALDEKLKLPAVRLGGRGISVCKVKSIVFAR